MILIESGVTYAQLQPELAAHGLRVSSPSANALRYQQKIREVFNPNDLGDAYYVTLES